MTPRWLALIALSSLVACDTMDTAPGASRRPTAQPPLIERETAPPVPEHVSLTPLTTLEQDGFSYLEGSYSRASDTEGYLWALEAFNGTHHARLNRAPHRSSYRTMLRMIQWGPHGQLERSATLDLRRTLAGEVVGVDVDAQGARVLLRRPDPSAAASPSFLWSEVSIAHCAQGLCPGAPVALPGPWVPAARAPVARPVKAPLTFSTPHATCAMSEPGRASCLMGETARRTDLKVLASAELPDPETCHSPGTLRDGRALVVCQAITVTPPRRNCQHCRCGTCQRRCRSTRVGYAAPSVWALGLASPDRAR